MALTKCCMARRSLCFNIRVLGCCGSGDLFRELLDLVEADGREGQGSRGLVALDRVGDLDLGALGAGYTAAQVHEVTLHVNLTTHTRQPPELLSEAPH